MPENQSCHVQDRPAQLFTLAESIPFLLRDTQRQFLRALQSKLSKHGISTGQWYFLRVLWEEEGLSQAELAQRVGLMTPTTVTTLNKLERAKLIERRSHPSDRRKYLIYLTDKGMRLKLELLTVARDVHSCAMEGISIAQLDQLRHTINALRGNLARMNDPESADEMEVPR